MREEGDYTRVNIGTPYRWSAPARPGAAMWGRRARKRRGVEAIHAAVAMHDALGTQAGKKVLTARLGFSRAVHG